MSSPSRGVAPAGALSPVEHVFSGESGYPITFVFSFASVLDVERMQCSLEQTIAHFPWVWSQLEISADQLSLQLVPRTEPVSFDPQLADIVTKPGAPLVSFCVARTGAGSTLAVSVSHALADAGSLFHFLTSWARIARAEPIFEPVRVGIPYSSKTLGDRNQEQIWSDSGLYPGGVRERLRPDGLDTQRHRLTHDDLNALRVEAQRDSEIMLSTNDVVTAYVWKRFVPKWCEAAGETDASMNCPVDMRRLLGLPPTHFGCALGFAQLRMDLACLRESSLGSVAARVRRAIKAVDADRILTANGTLGRVPIFLRTRARARARTRSAGSQAQKGVSGRGTGTGTRTGMTTLIEYRDTP